MIRKCLTAFAVILFMALNSTGALAIQPEEMLKDQKMEHRAREISAELRCLVCQNQSIDDSDASLAKDLRLLVRERLQAGDSNEQVLDYIVGRYGDFVLLRPPFKLETFPLWFFAPVILLVGGFGIYLMVKRRRKQAVAPLSADEQAELDSLLKK